MHDLSNPKRNCMRCMKNQDPVANIVQKQWLTLESDFNDFEDAIQYHTAIENDIPIIITRHLKDFKTAKIPVLTAKDYIELRN